MIGLNAIGLNRTISNLIELSELLCRTIAMFLFKDNLKSNSDVESHAPSLHPLGQAPQSLPIDDIHSEEGLEEIASRYIKNQKRLEEIGPKSL